MWLLRFDWVGALVGFTGFNYLIGLDILSKAYRLMENDKTSTVKSNAKVEGAGHILNYLIQVVAVTVGGGFLAGNARFELYKTHRGSVSATVVWDWGIALIAVTILLWAKLCSDTPPLRRFCIYLMGWWFDRPLKHRDDGIPNAVEIKN